MQPHAISFSIGNLGGIIITLGAASKWAWFPQGDFGAELFFFFFVDDKGLLYRAKEVGVAHEKVTANGGSPRTISQIFSE